MPNPPILIIEDDQEQISVLASMIGSPPYPIVTAFDGKRALKILQEHTPVLVITDMVLPDISGSDLIHFIRANARFVETKIIIVTAFLKYVSPSDHELADRVLLKPVQQADLQQALAELLGD